MKSTLTVLVLLGFAVPAIAQDTTKIDTVKLSPVHVIAKKRQAEFLDEFHRRADQVAHGGGGYILTRPELEHAGQMSVGRLLATVPGVHYVATRGDANETVFLTRGNCAPRFYLDGAPLAVNNINMISSGSLEGVEVYSGLGSGPAEYFDPRGCGTILLWSQRGAPNSTSKYPLIGLGVIGTVVAILLAK